MVLARLRRLLFEHLILNLALLLGVAQVLVWHWGSGVLIGRAGFGPAHGLALCGLLAAFNVVTAPVVRRARRRPGWAGRAASLYLELSIATLLLGMAVAAAWMAFVPVWGLARLADADPEIAFAIFRGLGSAWVGAWALLILWGFTAGQARIDRTRLQVRIPGLHPDLHGLRLVQISDLHIGNSLDAGRLERMVERTNALDPDVIAVTGDLFDFDPGCIDEGARRLAALRAPLGVYAVLGNHDTYTGAEEIASALARLAPNIALLRDRVARLPLDQPLYLAGVEDPGRHWSERGLELGGLEAVAAARPDDGPTILLVHRPEAFPQAARLGFPLVLAGHTHGGQLALPTPGGRYNLARLVTGFTRGLYRAHGSTLYVNRGLGVGGPALRINCPREIATIELLAVD
jgi:predicted MPP superfamily phosphohydrolase